MEVVMYYYNKISKVYKTSPQIYFDTCSKIVLMSDVHRGDGSSADNFALNKNIYMAALNHYYRNNYTYFELGDGDELWETKKMSQIVDAHCDTFELLSKFHKDERLYFIYGNHDKVKARKKWAQKNMKKIKCTEDHHCIEFPHLRIYQGLVLANSETKDKILLLHGHQADFFNDELWLVSRFLVRYLWRPLQLIGFKDPTSASRNIGKKNVINRRLIHWSNKERKMLIAGHTHLPVYNEPQVPKYFNDGCCVHPRYITAIEICHGKIFLVKWSIKTRCDDNTLYVDREVLRGPEELKDYF